MDYWEENGLTKPQQVVVCAAIRFGDVILCGARHWDGVMRQQVRTIGSNPLCSEPDGVRWDRGRSILRGEGKEEQGFIDQFGEYLTREHAMELVKANGQPFNIERNGGDIHLFSEGLY